MNVLQTYRTFIALMGISDTVSGMTITARKTLSGWNFVYYDNYEFSAEIAVLILLRRRQISDETTERVVKAVLSDLHSSPCSGRVECEMKTAYFRSCKLRTHVEEFLQSTTERPTSTSSTTETATEDRRLSSIPENLFNGTLLAADPSKKRVVIYEHSCNGLWIQTAPVKNVLSIDYCNIDKKIYWVFKTRYMTTSLVKKPLFSKRLWKYQSKKGFVREIKCDHHDNWYFIVTLKCIYRTKSMTSRPILVESRAVYKLFLSRTQQTMYFIFEARAKTRGRRTRRKPPIYLESRSYWKGPNYRRLELTTETLFQIQDRATKGGWMLTCTSAGFVYLYQIGHKREKRIGPSGCIAAGYDKDFNIMILQSNGNFTVHNSKTFRAMFSFIIQTDFGPRRGTLQTVNSRNCNVQTQVEVATTKQSTSTSSTTETPAENFRSSSISKNSFHGTLLAADPSKNRLVIYKSLGSVLWIQTAPMKKDKTLTIEYCNIDKMVYWVYKTRYMVTKLVKDPHFVKSDWKNQFKKDSVRQIKCDPHGNWYFIVTSKCIYRANSMTSRAKVVEARAVYTLFLSRTQQTMFFLYNGRRKPKRRTTHTKHPFVIYLGSRSYSKSPVLKRIEFKPTTKTTFQIYDSVTKGGWMLVCSSKTGGVFAYRLDQQSGKTVGRMSRCFAAGYDKDFNIIILQKNGMVTVYDSKKFRMMSSFIIPTDFGVRHGTLQVLDES